jgi:demethylmenaquinone methyltransferase/2-methoxy-6-polyprenyl-1,4-benzoquinol methylase
LVPGVLRLIATAPAQRFAVSADARRRASRQQLIIAVDSAAEHKGRRGASQTPGQPHAKTADLGHTLVNKPDTDFGFERVAWNEKERRVRGVFDSVADNYDLMNDLMSGGVHRLWKQFVLSLTALSPGQRALDVAGGTGDLTAGMSKQVGDQGLVVLSDINAAMLDRGRDRLADDGIVANVAFAQANAEKLPFADESFQCVTIGFGLRNVTDKSAALASMRRVLRPGGQLLVLEFSKPVAPGLKALYDAYSFRILPLLGKWVANDEASYRYLAESIRMHPDQETLLGMMRDAGLEDCRYHNLTGGIVAVHRGYRY